VVGYLKECIGCSSEFETDLFRRNTCENCRVGKNPGRTARRAAHVATFVGVDGESVNRPDGSHEYVMLSVGDDTLFQAGERLGFTDIMSFLWQRHLASPEAIFVGFFLGYDFTQWERLLPEAVARSLISTAGIQARTSSNPKNPYPDCVVYEGWEFDTLNNRRWKMRPHRHVRSAFSDTCRNRTCNYVLDLFDEIPLRPHEADFVIPESDGAYSDFDVTWRSFPNLFGRATFDYLYICDTGSFWQTSFLNVINPAGWSEPICTEDEYALVRQGKSVRDSVVPYGDTSYRQDMEAYNKLENDLLARVTARLHSGFVSGDICIPLAKSDWYGPGRAAQQWMNMLSVKQSIKADDIYSVMPEWAVEACQASYYGGWFEVPMQGHLGTVYEYDINSAYPHVISTLPCLLHGKWTRGITGVPVGSPYTLVHADVRGANPYIGAMPHRDKHGRISRPQHVKGWYWLDEILAAQTAGLVDSYTIDEWVDYAPDSCGHPFDPPDIGITRMYETRLRVGKDTPQGKALKLVYNSAYGKTAQSVGNPRFGNPFYASRITSGTRTVILGAISHHEFGAAGVAMVATDGVYFTSPHMGLREGKSLGDWECQVKQGMTILMPGVYWDDKARAALATDSPVPVRSRGVSGKDIATVLLELDRQWDEFDGDWPSVNIPIGFNVTSSKSALHRGKWQTAGSVVRGGIKTLSADPRSKRDPRAYRDEAGRVRTSPYGEASPLESVPYDKTFGHEQFVLDQLASGVTADFEEWADFFSNDVVPGV
jgi:hypothetical protein